MEESANFTKLMYEQDRVLKSNEECQKVRDKLKEDYMKLKQRLQTLPDNVSEDIMIPVGKVAYFPGRLIHTNEIMVLLGDNWFAERSAKQAIEIVDRRVAMVENQLSELKKEEVHIQSQKEYTDELLGVKEGRGGMKEIHEDLPDTEVSDFKTKGRQRKAHVPKHNQVQRTVKFKENRDEIGKDITRPNADSIDHNELLARLNQLEREEQEEEERQHEEQMKKIYNGEYSKAKTEDDRGGTSPDYNSPRRHVKFHDLNNDNNDSYDSEDEEICTSGNTIRFSHTPETKQVHRERSASESDLRKPINTPADLFDHFSCKTSVESGEKPLKSILKKDSRSNSTENLKLRPILKTSPEHQPGTPEQLFFDDPRPILKTPPDSQGSDRRPGTPEYTLSDDPRSILKSSSLDSSNLSSFDLDCSDPKPILKFADSQEEFVNSLSCESDGDETKSILKTSFDRMQEDSMNMEQRNQTFQDNITNTFQDEFRSQKIRNESPKRKTILKNVADFGHAQDRFPSERPSGHSSDQPFGVSEVVERSPTNEAPTPQASSTTATNKRPVSRFKASRSGK